MTKQSISDHLINILRQTVEERYQFYNLQNITNLNISISKEMVDELRSFFLQYIYPDAQTRVTLNKAFENLDRHIKSPMHLIDLLGNSISMAFHFGLQFPKAFRAGFQTLESFKQAILFEDILCSEAIAQNMKLPITNDDFEKMIAKLPQENVHKFIKNSDELFKTLTDIPLLKKSIEIISELIMKMKDKPKIYSKDDIDGITTALGILKAGYHLFHNLTTEEKENIIELIKEVENKNLERILEKYPQ